MQVSNRQHYTNAGHKDELLSWTIQMSKNYIKMHSHRAENTIERAFKSDSFASYANVHAH